MSIQGNLAVMRNAFSTASSGAKIPDGACSYSLTERLATAKSITSPNGLITIVLSPSMLTHLQVSTESTPATYTSYSTTIHASDSNPVSSGAIDRFRLVSAGLRLTCINGSETMNGWFEAIRVSSDYDNTDFSNGSILDCASFESNIAADDNWASSPSYVTGRLRDIGKHTFYLKNINNHEFQSSLGQPKFGFDGNYDTIIIKIHSIGASAENLQTAVHAHVVKNWELVYDAKNPLSRYHTSCPVWKAGVDNVKKAMARDPKASMIRSASAYAYR